MSLKAHILILTFATPLMRCTNKLVSDLPWLECCLRSLAKNASGFSGITVAHPEHEKEMFRPVLKKYGVAGWGYAEVPGKGMVQHMAKMAKADTFLPKDTEFVFHMDSDCVMHLPTTPEDYFTAGKPHLFYRTWQSLLESKDEPGYSGNVASYNQWKSPTEKQLGMKVDDAYTMLRHPSIYPIGLYEPYRKHVEAVQGVDFEEYMLSGKNAYPQDRLDFPAMGAFGFYKMHDAFHWINTVKQAHPVPRLKQFWSHNGITPEVRAEIEELLK